MRLHTLILAAVFLAGLSMRGVAQEQAAPQQTPALQPHETVVVIATRTGPAIWHATKDSADVAILGIVQPLPDNFVWDTKPLDAILRDAHLVRLPPQVRMGVLSGAWFYLTKSGLLHPP